MEQKKILLVDGNSLLFRAYYASSYTGVLMQTKSGIFTNAVYSFANMLTSLIQKGEYYDLKVAFDKGKHTFRHNKMEDYKGGRKTTPPELVQQFPIARELLESMNISYYEMDEVEADDLIGSMAKKINDEYPEMLVHILTSDKDMFQLINDKTLIELPKSGTSILEEFGEKELLEKWQVSPKQVPDLKGIMGDPSDNLKGVPGIGEKGAIKLLNEYNTLENVYENIENIKGAAKQKLIDGKESAFLCKDIATIRTSVYIENFEIRKVNITINKLIEFLTKYEMFSLLKRFSTSAEVINKEEKIEYKVISEWSHNFEADDNAIYVESLDTNYHTGKIIGIGISNEKGNFYINFGEKKQLDIFSMDDEKIGFDKNLDEFLKSNLNKNTYDLKRTIKLLENTGYEPNYDSFTYDMMSVGYILNPTVKSTYQNHLRLISTEFNLEDDEDVFGKGAKQNPDIEINKKAEFIAKKSFYINKTKIEALKQIDENKQRLLYDGIDFKLIEVLRNMENNGVKIDRDIHLKLTKNAELKINQIESEIKTMVKDYVDDDFNIASPKQIKELLYDKLGLPDKFKGSTNKEALEFLSPLNEVAVLLLEHRKWSKLYSTYLAGFEKNIQSDNRVYTIYNQNLTATGRLSSMEPNLQNISVRDEDQKEIRKMFVVDDGYEFYSYDYSQIELRVMAQLANEKHMIDIFDHDGDIHRESAMKIFNLSSVDEVTDEMRRVAKTFNFGIIYGLSDYGLSRDLNISIPEAKQLIIKYYETFPGIKQFKEDVIEFAKQNGYVETITKRRRYIPELASSNYQIRQFGERAAVNMPVQGAAADILKVAMINIYDQFKNEDMKSFMSIQIHDEIVFSILNSEKEKAIKIIKEEMNQAFKKIISMFELNLEVKVKLEESESHGQSWFDLK